MLSRFLETGFNLLMTVIQIPSSLYYLFRFLAVSLRLLVFVATEYVKQIVYSCFINPLRTVFLRPKISDYYYPKAKAINKFFTKNNRSLSINSSMDLTTLLSSKKPILVLDLDGTIIYTKRKSSFNVSYKYDLTATQKIDTFFHNKTEFLTIDFLNSFVVFYRPYINYFLKIVSKFYRIVVFTTSLSKYADPIIDKIASSHLIFRRYSRKHCIRKEDAQGKVYYEKNLDLLKADSKHFVILDDAQTFSDKYMFNWLPIEKYKGGSKDETMKSLIPFLLSLRSTGDFRDVLERHKLFNM
eukprot:GAHX01000222.1.p1 GENE.GAHX01000222.1~~GAHX01000222.1.p1  ORF type:complete len:298 (-),score=43.05 GAHX01000222.1:53-946(-)